MNAILALPLSVRMAIVAVAGAALGSLVNWATYRLAWHQCQISPWGPAPDGSARTWTDRIPILGWLGLRRESAVHGAGFWIRPLVIEVLMALGLAALYWWEVEQQALVVGQLQNILVRCRWACRWQRRVPCTPCFFCTVC